jgi:4-amino-4-deoxy-L-arabinose transferase-like glycosyltransferase
MNALIPKNLVFGALFVFGVRALVILLFGSDVPPDVTDHEVYHKGAVQLLSGWSEWVRPGTEFGYRAPLFFVYLAGVLGLFSTESYTVSQFASAFIGTLCCVAVFQITREIAGEAAGYCAFAVRGLFPNYILADTYVMSEQLFAGFLLCALLVVATARFTPRNAHAGLLGLAVGLMMLTREAGLVYPIIFAGYLLAAHGSRGDRVARGAVFASVLIITLSPWLIRNHVVWGTALPMTYTTGPSLHTGNNEGFTGEWRFPPKPDDPTIRFGTPEFERWHRDKAMAYILADPIRFVGRGFIKISWLVWPRFQRHDMNVVYPGFGVWLTPASVLVGIGSALVLLLGIGAFSSMPLSAYWWVGLSIVAIVVASIVATGGDPRYRDPIDYLLVIAIGRASAVSNPITTSLDALRADRWRIFLACFSWTAVALGWTWVAYYKLTQ